MKLEHRTALRVSKGSANPLGATLDEGGVNFALYSRHAGEVFLLLFDDAAGEPTDVIRLASRSRFIWHARIEGLRAGQLYGYVVRGEYRPDQGLRFDDSKLLLDPYAKAVTGKYQHASTIPKSIVIDDAFDWQGVRAPEPDLEQLVIYEVHVKGFTAHESSRSEFPGTYLGFIEKIPHLKRLGVNAVELLPVHEYLVDGFLTDRGLTNYWGYNSIGFFAPESSYGTRRAPGCQVAEFKTLVRELHRAGISVILDVVYNHTGEGNEMGPTLCFRGVDNLSYYTLTGPPEAPLRYYMNHSGCGNSLNFDSPAVIRLVMDSLRYWFQTMQVDGFRFDLASVLGRTLDGSFRSSASFFDAVSQDPVLCRAILIAEPWDIGTYQVGNFPVDWSEWNGRFRDTMRRFAKGDAGQLAEAGWRFTGSADLYGDDGRSAYNSVNFITCHDGFTLADLVSYNGKHNEANGEDNRDGANDNHSWNCGVEGPTADSQVLALRRRMMKNHACVLFFSCGTPLMLGGDEFARTQQGNNNAYCQDNEISWFDWGEVERNADLVEFFRKAIAFTRRFPALQRRQFPLGRDLDADGIPDLTWIDARWQDPGASTLCFQLDAAEDGAGASASRLLFIFNADHEPQWINLPSLERGQSWRRAIDTSLPAGADFAEPGGEIEIDPGDHYIANPRSTVVLVA